MFPQFQELDHFVQDFLEKLTLAIKLTFKFKSINYHSTSRLLLMLVWWKIIAGYAHFNWMWIVIVILVKLLTHLFETSHSLKINWMATL